MLVHCILFDWDNSRSNDEYAVNFKILDAFLNALNINYKYYIHTRIKQNDFDDPDLEGCNLEKIFLIHQSNQNTF